MGTPKNVHLMLGNSHLGLGLTGLRAQHLDLSLGPRFQDLGLRAKGFRLGVQYLGFL